MKQTGWLDVACRPIKKLKNKLKHKIKLEKFP